MKSSKRARPAAFTGVPTTPTRRKLIAAVPGTATWPSRSTRNVKPALEIDRLSKHLRRPQSAGSGEPDHPCPGETVAIVGESGSGKSTLAKTLLRLEDADIRRRYYQGQDLITMSASDLFATRREIQMVFQDPTQSLNPRMTAGELIAEAFRDPSRDSAEGPMAGARLRNF